MRQTALTTRTLGILCLGVTAAILCYWYWPSKQGTGRPSLSEKTFLPIQSPAQGYAGSSSCKRCHEQEHSTWHASFHRTMTQVASPETVLGDFDDVHLDMSGIDFHLSQSDEEFFVDLPNFWDQTGKGPERIQREIVQVTGAHHQQTYWFPLNESHLLQRFPFTYLVNEQKWIHWRAAFVMPPNDRLIPEPGNWNYNCLTCHSTGPRPNYRWMPEEDPNSVNARFVATEVSEFGISCEACHGPGLEHVQDHEKLAKNKQVAQDADPPAQLVTPEQLDPKLASQICGQCHSLRDFRTTEEFVQWSKNGPAYRPGEELDICVLHASSRDPLVRQLLANRPAETVVWPDGMIRVSGREYNGLIESPCFTHDDSQRQMTCLSCHTMHANEVEPNRVEQWADDQLLPGMRANQACTQCHTQYSSSTAVIEHTRHRALSSGSNCLNCHMPHTTYGLLKAIRSHKISSPSVQESLENGRPNACNQCHLDKSLMWTGEHLQAWYNIEPPELNSDEQHLAASILWTLKGDAGLRALMAWSMGWESAREASGADWMRPYLAQLLADPYPAVRLIAHNSLQQHPGFGDFPDTPDTNNIDELREFVTNYAPLAGRVAGASPQLLLDENGKLETSGTYTRLLRARDNRPVFLNE